MKRDYATVVTGWFFIIGALMFWLGWMLMPVHIGTFFDPEDFSAVHAHLHFWIWMYRIHLFGFAVTMMALVALGALPTAATARTLVWPGVAMAGAGLIVGAVGAAFYYHFGAWGAIDMAGESAKNIQRFVNSLRVDTDYVTCIVRFGRVFFGLGQLVLALGLLKWKVLPRWNGASAALLGIAAMALTMAFPNNLEVYAPVFHLNALWLAATGIQTLRSGFQVTD